MSDEGAGKPDFEKLFSSMGAEIYAQSRELADQSMRLKLANDESGDRAAEFQAILDAAPVAVWIAHDPQCLRITGNAYADQTVMQTVRGSNVSASAPPGDEAVSYRVFRNGVELRPEELPSQVAAATGKTVPEGEFELIFSDGRTVNMLMGAVPLFDADGRVRGSVAAGVDVTGRKQAEAALRASEERLRLTLDGTGLGTFEHRPETGECFWDAGARAVWGLSSDAEISYPEVLERIHPEERARVRATMDASLRTASTEPSQAEHRVIWPDGSVHWILCRCRTLFAGEGEQRHATRVMGVYQDITERKRAEEALQESEAHYRTLSETMLQGVVYQDDQGRVLSMNPAAETILGRTHAEFLGSTSLDAGQDSIREDGSPFAGLEHPSMVALATGREVRNVRMGVYSPRAKQYRWIEINAVPLFRAGEARPYQVYTIFEDVTDRKQAEAALRDSDDHFRTLANAIPQLCSMANADGWIFWYNQRWYEYTGTTPEQMEGWGWQSVHDPEMLAEVLDRWKGSLATGEPFDMTFPLRGVDGVFRPFLTRIMPVRDRDGKVSGWFGTNTDVSEQQKIEAALRGSEELLKTFVKHVPAAVAMLDREMRYLQVSDRWYADYSLKNGEILGRSHYEVFPEIPERWKQLHRRCLAGETLRADEDCWERAGGEPTWLRWEIRPWGDQGGMPAGVLIFTEDITGRKAIEASLRESEATIRALLETAAQSILAVDSVGVVVLANRMAEEMFGYGRSELPGMPLEKLVPERSRLRHVSYRAEFAANPRTRPMGTGLDLQGLRKDGTEFPIEVSLSTVQTSRGALAVAFVSDITRRKQAEAALQGSESELRALARSLLTAQEDERRRVARDLHDDVTQRLALLSIEIGKLATETPSSVDEIVTRLRFFQRQARLASNEVRRLSHGLHPSVIEDFGLSTALEEFCEEFARAQGINLIFDGLVPDVGLSAGGASCLYRVAQECLRNAAKHSGATEVRVGIASDGANVQLTVKDNGSGFVAGADRVNPGLGLVSMKERIKMANGTLSINSHPGKGTEIVATVPLPGGAA